MHVSFDFRIAGQVLRSILEHEPHVAEEVISVSAAIVVVVCTLMAMQNLLEATSLVKQYASFRRVSNSMLMGEM